MTKTIFLAFVALFFYACNSGGSYATPPNTIFEQLIKKPIPPYITDIEVAGECWQGYSIFFKFKASDEFLKNFDDEGFTETEWNDISYRMELPDGFEKRFKTGWHPSKIKNKKCYKKQVDNDWGAGADHYFVYDIDKQIVYFYGVGA